MSERKTIYLDDAINIVEFESGEWIGLAKTITDGLKRLPSAEPEILSDFKRTLFGISEICVDVSKCNITAEEGIQQIRDKYLDTMYRKIVQNYCANNGHTRI